MPRVSIPVDERLRAEVADSPGLFGLDESLSEAQRLACLLAVGAEAMRAQVSDARRRDLYAELAADSGYAESVAETSQLARDHGLV